MASRSTSEVAGAQIRALRLRKGWSCAELGRRVGLSRKGISKIELGGSTTVLRLDAIAKALGVTTADLLPERGEPAGEGR
jgi:transcriptional regulator with XRE-family HTH domain